MEQAWGPVITAIDAGHVERGGRCERCTATRTMSLGKVEKIAYPCPDMLAARVQQRVYAERLRTRKAIEAGRLSSLAAR